MARSIETSTLTADWSDAETMAEAQLWQVKAGAVALTFGAGAAPSFDAGITLLAGDVIRIEAGEVVRRRRTSGEPAILVREPKV